MKEGDILDYAKTPLLSSNGQQQQIKNVNGQGGVYTYTNLRNDFFSKLPAKVQPGIDPESPYDLDLSKTSGLVEGECENPIYIINKKLLLMCCLLATASCLSFQYSYTCLFSSHGLGMFASTSYCFFRSSFLESTSLLVEMRAGVSPYRSKTHNAGCSCMLFGLE